MFWTITKQFWRDAWSQNIRILTMGTIMFRVDQIWVVNPNALFSSFGCNTSDVKMTTVAIYCTITLHIQFHCDAWPYKHGFRHLIHSVRCIIGWDTIKKRKIGNGGTNLHITPTWDTFSPWEHSLSFSTHFFPSEKLSEKLFSRGCTGTYFSTKLIVGVHANQFYF